METSYTPSPEPENPVGGTPGQPCGGVGTNTSEICNCLDCSLGAINSSLLLINQTLYDKLGSPCDKIDGCMDKIIEKLKDKLKGPAWSCEQCKDAINQGLAGTLEFAVRCAGACIDTCNTACSMGDKSTEGKCCKTCGAEKCKCVNGECKPVKEEEEQKGEWYAWCNRETGLVLATKKGEGGPPAGYETVGMAETELAAIALATANCSKTETPIFIPKQELPPPTAITSGWCNLAGYSNGAIHNDILAKALGSRSLEAGKIANDRAREVGIFGFSAGSVEDTLLSYLQWSTGAAWTVDQQMAPHVAGLLGCNDNGTVEALRVMSAIGVLQKNTGLNVDEFMQPFKYSVNYHCPRIWLGPDQAMAAYLSNAIEADKLSTIWQMHGYCPDNVQWNLHASKSKPIPLQLAAMRHREWISASEYHNGMRELGYLESETRENLFKLTTQIPTITDIIRFMVRDADDETANGPVHKFNLDAEFDAKYGKQLKKWATDQGIDENFARYAWRSHWSIPSPTQLFQFVRRLRHDPRFPNLLDDVKTALIQQDILPYWHEHYLSVVYNPLTRVDVRRAFNIGSIDETQVFKSYVDAGYSDDNATILTQFTVKLRDQAASSHKAVKLWLDFAIDRPSAQARMESSNIPPNVAAQALDDASIKFQSSPYASAYSRGDMSAELFGQKLSEHGVRLDIISTIIDLLSTKKSGHPILLDYQAGVTEREQAKIVMQRDRIPDATINGLLDQVDASVNRSFVVACQKGIKTRYLLGEIDKAQAINELEQRGTVSERARKMVDWWGCELKSGRKQVSASKLCDWLAQGVIDAADYKSRLVAIGYSNDDAGRLLADCLSGISAKRTKLAEQEAKDEAQASYRRNRALAQAAAAESRAINRMNSMREKAAKLKTQRERSLLAAAGKMAKKCNCDLFDALQAVKSHYKDLQDNYHLSIDESLKVITIASDNFAGGGPQEYAEIIKTLADGVVAANVSGDTVYLSIPPSTNGQT